MMSSVGHSGVHLHLLLGIQPLRDLSQLKLELGLWGHHKDEPLQRGRSLVAQEEHHLTLAALILCLQSNLRHSRHSFYDMLFSRKEHMLCVAWF